jgi:hypothetical protein
MAQQIKITQTSNADMNIGVPKNLTMEQQTAVEWLIDRFLFAGYAIPTEWKEQAKAMEKEQIIKAAQVVLWNNTSNSKEVAEQYYNETYHPNKD